MLHIITVSVAITIIFYYLATTVYLTEHPFASFHPSHF